MITRKLGRSDIEVSAVGLGCWAIGGPFTAEDGNPVGWGRVDDKESIRAIGRALDLGVTLFDTADVYGCGHSERILGQALGKRRSDVAIATKFGRVFDASKRHILGNDASPEHIRQACEASLSRLNTDVIDLYQLVKSRLSCQTLMTLAPDDVGYAAQSSSRVLPKASFHSGSMARLINGLICTPCHRRDAASIVA